LRGRHDTNTNAYPYQKLELDLIIPATGNLFFLFNEGYIRKDRIFTMAKRDKKFISAD